MECARQQKLSNRSVRRDHRRAALLRRRACKDGGQMSIKIKKKTIDNAPLLRRPAYEKLVSAIEDLGEHWLWNNEFLEHYSISQSATSRYALFFERYIVRVNNRIIWTGDEEMAKEMREKYGE
jgi:hypothetical protein